MWAWALLLLLAGYGALVALIYFSQGRILFPAPSVAAAGPLDDTARPLELVTSSGERLHGVHIPPAEIVPGRRLVVLGFGGNAWNGQSAAETLHDLYPTAHVVAFHYRGYAPSEGHPDAAALQADALLIHDHVRQHFGDSRIVAIGFSIGSAVAAFLAGNRPIDGAILVTPFDSLARVASDHYPWIPVSLLLRHEMEPAKALQESNVPIAIIAAADDKVIPSKRKIALEQAVPRLVFSRTIRNASHNDLYQRASFAAAMEEAIEALGLRDDGTS